jgi:hypothetical protein
VKNIYKYFVFSLLMTSSVFAESPLTRYLIDPGTRGPFVVSTIKTLNTTPFLTNRSEVAIQVQTGRGFQINGTFAPVGRVQGLTAGFIPYVQSTYTKAFETLVILEYQVNSSAATNPFYLVVPVERIVGIMYSPQPIGSPGMTSTFPRGVLPLSSIDPATRAADLVSVFTELTTKSPYTEGSPAIGLFTTLAADYNPQIMSGFIPNISAIAASGPYLFVTYFPASNAGKSYKVAQTIVVSAEQVNQLVYFADNRKVTPTGGFNTDENSQLAQ